jgi:hypothetical protein
VRERVDRRLREARERERQLERNGRTAREREAKPQESGEASRREELGIKVQMKVQIFKLKTTPFWVSIHFKIKIVKTTPFYYARTVWFGLINRKE